MQIDASGSTDVGRVRKNNEDAFKIEADLALFVLSDGMGGQAHGEVASAIAVETVAAHCRQSTSDPNLTLCGDRRADLSARSNRLMSAVRLANRRIFESAMENRAREGMGATVVAAWIENGDGRETGRRLSLAHVGDSRAYLFRSGALQQLTADHSLVAEHVRRGTMTPQEAERSQLQNVLIRALGAQEQVEVDVDEQLLLPGDILLLCSDGLTHSVTDPEIASILATHEPAKRAVDRLIDVANESGGEDNITVIVARMQAEASGFLSRFRGRQR